MQQFNIYIFIKCDCHLNYSVEECFLNDVAISLMAGIPSFSAFTICERLSSSEPDVSSFNTKSERKINYVNWKKYIKKKTSHTFHTSKNITFFFLPFPTCYQGPSTKTQRFCEIYFILTSVCTAVAGIKQCVSIMENFWRGFQITFPDFLTSWANFNFLLWVLKASAAICRDVKETKHISGEVQAFLLI